jgi:conjugal transfer/entry exclusion protein
LQTKKEDLEKQILLLSSMVEEMSTEQEQLQAERDRLGEALGSLHAMQAAVPIDPRPQVTVAVAKLSD